MNLEPKEISKILNVAEKNYLVNLPTVNQLAYDTRLIKNGVNTLFFAIKTDSSDGHDYIEDAYAKGVRNFIIERETTKLKNANYFLVKNTISALQKIAIIHRKKFKISVLAITGSYGKTIIKEWLSQIMETDLNIVKNPRSYNSQIGVPFSISLLRDTHEFGIFEAGISLPNEMNVLERIIKPTIGLLTNIGNAHLENFDNLEHLLNEKLKLFKNCKSVIYKDQDLLSKHLNNNCYEAFAWKINFIKKVNSHSFVEFQFKNRMYSISLPFIDNKNIENAIHVSSFLLHQLYDIKTIEKRISELKAIPMRLSMRKVSQGNLIIDDSYILDLDSLKVALDFQNNFCGNLKPILILSDPARSNKSYFGKLEKLLSHYNLSKIFWIGTQSQELITPNILNFNDYKACTDYLKHYPLTHSSVLIKGARKFKLEKIVHFFEKRVHDSFLEINLDHLQHNYSVYKNKLKPKTKIIGVIKAGAYGSGAVEIAQTLSFCKVDYIAVAYIQEAITLRKNNIQERIIILNPQDNASDELFDHKLEPEIYSLNQLKSICKISKDRKICVHLNLNTGMNRLGLEPGEFDRLIKIINQFPKVIVSSIFSHISASEDPTFDAFTHSQAQIFEKYISVLKRGINYDFDVHFLNSAGIVRFPEYQFDMVRLGLGMYGIDAADQVADLKPVHALYSQIISIKTIQNGESVGYSRNFKAVQETKIATIPIGYADGILRTLGNQRYSLKIGEQFAQIIGNINMDLITLDISNIKNASIGSKVVLFDYLFPLQKMAQSAKTIPYEIISRISERVPRVYIKS